MGFSRKVMYWVSMLHSSTCESKNARAIFYYVLNNQKSNLNGSITVCRIVNNLDALASKNAQRYPLNISYITMKVYRFSVHINQHLSSYVCVCVCEHKCVAYIVRL